MRGRFFLFLHEKPFSRPLIIIALQIAFISALFSYYDVEIPFRYPWSLVKNHLVEVPFLGSAVQKILQTTPYFRMIVKNKSTTTLKLQHYRDKSKEQNYRLFTPEQLALFDGSRQSKPVYLAILGRIYNVDEGRKHYGVGGGYHFFAGKDATRAFVTGDFTETGLTPDLTDLNTNEILAINDWLAFYEREYEFVGLLYDIYYDNEGKPTETLEKVNKRIEEAIFWKQKQISESEVFPPCNSEWKKEAGGRVWCSNKSGGIVRDWVGVPRMLFNPSTKQHRCVCVKNFGSSRLAPDTETSHGDLENRNLREYPDCSPTANSCKIST